MIQQKTCPICDKVFKGPNAKLRLRDHTAEAHHNALARKVTKTKTRQVHNQRLRSTMMNPTVSVGELTRGMSALSAQPQDVDLLNRVKSTTKFTDFRGYLAKSLGNSPEGRAWALSALHPCGEGEIVSADIGNLAGMPDTMTGSVVTPNYRSETTIQFDGTKFAVPVPATDNGTWDVQIVIPPIPEIDYIYRLVYHGTTTQTSYWVTVRTPNMPLNGADEAITFGKMGYGKVRLIGLGHTFTLEGNATNEQGRVVVGQMEGQWTEEWLQPVSTNMSIGSGGAGTGLNAITSRLPVTSGGMSTKVQLLNVPVDTSTITSACPSAYQDNAKKGAYVVQKFSAPLLGYQFKRTANGSTYPNDVQFQDQAGTDWEPPDGWDENTAVATMPTSAFMINTSNSDALIDAETFEFASSYGPDVTTSIYVGEGETQAFLTTGQMTPHTSEPSDMMVAVVVFTGLVKNATVGGTPTIRVKGRQHFECIANANNPSTSPFVHAPADYDMTALEHVIIAGKRMADGYPACYNEEGDILGSIWSALKGVAHPLLGAIGGTGIPILSNIANGLGKVI